MALSARRLCFLLALLLFQEASCQQPADVIGYVVEEGHPIITVRCRYDQDTVATHVLSSTSSDQVYLSKFLFCRGRGQDRGQDRECDPVTTFNSFMGPPPPQAPTEGQWYGSKPSGVTLPCVPRTTNSEKPDDPTPCGEIKVIESWPNHGSTMGVIDCMPGNIPTSVSKLYRNKPENLPKGFTEPTTTPIPTPKSRDGQKKGGGPNVNLIVGAVVGSVGGCGLIAAALYLGFRIGRRRAADETETRPSRGIRERLQSVPRPVVSVAWKRQPRAESGEVATTMQPTAVSRDPVELDANFSQLPAETVFVSGAEGKPPTRAWG